MHSRSDIHAKFVARFRRADQSPPITEAELQSIEAALDTTLPAAFREFAMRYGAVHVPTLDAIVDRGLNHPDIQEFFAAPQIIEYSRLYWTGGMPDNVIGVASDCMGNMFGFLRTPVRLDDAPVVFFDHDLVDVGDIAASFDSLLTWYLDHAG